MGPPEPPAGPIRRYRYSANRTTAPTDPDYEQSYAVPTLSQLGNISFLLFLTEN